MAQISALKDQLLSLAVNNFIIISSTGEVVECSGDFTDTNKQQLAHTVLQQCYCVLEPGEELKRASFCIDDVAYITITVKDDDKLYGVLIKKSKAWALIAYNSYEGEKNRMSTLPPPLHLIEVI